MILVHDLDCPTRVLRVKKILTFNVFENPVHYLVNPINELSEPAPIVVNFKFVGNADTYYDDTYYFSMSEDSVKNLFMITINDRTFELEDIIENRELVISLIEHEKDLQEIEALP